MFLYLTHAEDGFYSTLRAKANAIKTVETILIKSWPRIEDDGFDRTFIPANATLSARI
jgi:hypothetical protein